MYVWWWLETGFLELSEALDSGIFGSGGLYSYLLAKFLTLDCFSSSSWFSLMTLWDPVFRVFDFSPSLVFSFIFVSFKLDSLSLLNYRLEANSRCFIWVSWPSKTKGEFFEPFKFLKSYINRAPFIPPTAIVWPFSWKATDERGWSVPIVLMSLDKVGITYYH